MRKFKVSFYADDEKDGVMFAMDCESHGTVALTPTALTITVPIRDEGNDYFCNERLLINLVSEGLELLAGIREQEWVEERIALKARIPGPDTAKSA